MAFFLHGGAFILGSAKHPYAAPDPDAFVASTGAVYVKSQYRLGALGFLAHPAMPAPSAGVFGLGDQRTALRWLNRHASAFGGDKDRVMAMGSSAGAMSLCFHMVDPRTRGLFRTVMLQSPQCSFPFPTLEESHLRARRLAQAVGCEAGGADAAELRSALLAVGHSPGSPLDAATGDRALGVMRSRRAAAASRKTGPGGQGDGGDGSSRGAVTPLPAPLVDAPASWLSSAWWEGVLPTTPYDPSTAGMTPSLEGQVSLWMRGNKGVFPTAGGLAVPPRPVDASPADLAAELLCLRSAGPLTLADAIPPRRASFWFDGDIYMPVINGADVERSPAETLATRGFADPSLTLLGGVQRSEGTLFAMLGFPVIGFGDLMVRHLETAMGDRVAHRLWRHYFPPTGEELLLEGPGGEESPHAGPAGLAETAQRALDDVTGASPPAAGWRRHGRVSTRTPHHRAPTVGVSPAVRWVSEAFGSREWTSIANVITDVWRCSFTALARRAAAASAGTAAHAATPDDRLAEIAAELAAEPDDPSLYVRAPPTPSSASPRWLPSRVYLYHMLHAPSSLSWPGHRMGAFHGSEVPILYNSTLVHPADRALARVMQPLVNRTLWEGRPDADGDCTAEGRPAEGRRSGDRPAWCPVAVPSAEAANAELRTRPGDGGRARGSDARFELHAMHISRGENGTGMRPFMHERRTGAWVCEDLYSEIVHPVTLRFEVPAPIVEPVAARLVNVVALRVVVAIAKRPTVRAAVLTVFGTTVLAVLVACWLSRAARSCASGFCCACCCCCYCFGLCCGRRAEPVPHGTDAKVEPQE